jgi:hypothetical protein
MVPRPGQMLCLSDRRLHQQADGRPSSLMADVRRVIMGRNNLDMTQRQYLLHRETELQQHVAARIREYEAMLTVIGYLSGALTPPPPMTNESLRRQVMDAVSAMGGSLLDRSRRTTLDQLNPLNVPGTLLGWWYKGTGAVAGAVGAEETGRQWDGIGNTMLETDIVDLTANAVRDIVASIVDSLRAYWDRFWAEADANGFLIAYGKLRIDAGFLAAELAIDVALGAVTGGAGAAAGRVIRVVGRRVAQTATRVTVKIGNVGEAIPDSRRILQLDVPDADIPPRVERLLDENNLGGAAPLADTRQRAAPVATAATTTYARGPNRATITTDPTTGRPVSGQATIRRDYGGSDRNDNATAIGALGRPGDHGGHIFAHRFFGDVPDQGIVPQAGNLNTGAWKRMENEWADWLAYGRTNGQVIEIDVNVRIDPPGAVRPDRFRGNYTVYEIGPGGERIRLHRNTIDMRNEPGQTFNRVYFRTDPDGTMHRN